MTEMDKNKSPINIYLDLSKAFVTLDYQILLKKLQYYGITGTSLNLFQNYLKNRKKDVEYDDVSSILGPLLFIVYLNDMSQVSKIFAFIIYADDTTLSTILRAFKPSTPHENMETEINMELSKITDWLIVNKLSLNISKTKYTVFHSKQK